MSMEDIQDSQVLTINIGGKKYTTRRQTLTGLQNYQHGKDNEGNIFIDRDGDCFKHVLNYMRREKLILPKGYTDIDGLIEEAKHYGVKKLQEELQRFKEKQTAILWVKDVSPEEQQQVQGASDEIQLWCSPQALLNLQFLEIRNVKYPISYQGRQFNNIGQLKSHIANHYTDESSKVTIVYTDRFQFLSILVKEGFEKKQSWGTFTMYKHA